MLETIGQEEREAPEVSSSQGVDEAPAVDTDSGHAPAAQGQNEAPMPGDPAGEVDLPPDEIPVDEGEPQGDGERQEDREMPGTPPPRVRPPASPARPSLIDQFARRQGFIRLDENRYRRHDGSLLVKVNGAVFSWERRSIAGEIVQYYWIREHCLAREPLQINYEVWAAVELQPDQYTFILTGPEEEPHELSGRMLCAMRDTGQLKLDPAAYRLTLNYDGVLTSV